MPVTTQWPLKRAATSPHLSGFVFYGCLESLTELSALWGIVMEHSSRTNTYSLQPSVLIMDYLLSGRQNVLCILLENIMIWYTYDKSDMLYLYCLSFHVGILPCSKFNFISQGFLIWNEINPMDYICFQVKWSFYGWYLFQTEILQHRQPKDS